MRAQFKVFAAFTGSHFVGTVTQVLRGKLAAILLGTAGVGVLNQLTSFVSLAQVISSLGFNVGIVRGVALGLAEDDADAVAAQVSSAGLVLAATSLLTALLVILGSQLLSNWLFVDGGARAGLVSLVGLAIPLLTIANFYKSVLSGSRSIRGLVGSQMTADLLSVAVFAALIFPLGLVGATLAFVCAQMLLLVFRAHAAFRTLGWRGIMPNLRDYRWTATRENLTYGVYGLMTAGMSVAAMVLVTRHIIATMGEADSGIFTTAAKVGTLFLAGVYSAASSYVLPSLIAAADQRAANQQTSDTIKLYMFSLAPVMAGLMALGEPLIHIMFAEAFIFAGVLLVPLIIADFLRIVTETIGLSLVANRNLVAITLSYSVYVVALVGLVYSHLLGRGLLAIGTSFIVAQAIHLGVVAITARVLLGVSLSRSTLVIGVYTLAYIFGAAWICLNVVSVPIQLGLVIALSGVWLAINFLSPDFRELVAVIIRRVFKLA